MKSIILSMFTVLALSDSVTNVIHENTPRLITNNRQILSENDENPCAIIGQCEPTGISNKFFKPVCTGDDLELRYFSESTCAEDNRVPDAGEMTAPNNICCQILSGGNPCMIDECIPNPDEPNTFLKAVCRGDNDAYVRKFSKSTCTYDNRIDDGSENMQTNHFCCRYSHCSKKESATIGRCDLYGVETLETVETAVYEIRTCLNANGDSIYKRYANGCSEANPVLFSEESKDPCCITREPECDEFDKCEYYGKELLSETNPVMVDSYEMTYCSGYGEKIYERRAYGCVSTNPVTYSYLSYDQCCATERCEKEEELDKCVYNAASGESSKYYCKEGALAYTTWNGNDCSDTIVRSFIEDNDACCSPLNELF